MRSAAVRTASIPGTRASASRGMPGGGGVSPQDVHALSPWRAPMQAPIIARQAGCSPAMRRRPWFVAVRNAAVTGTGAAVAPSSAAGMASVASAEGPISRNASIRSARGMLGICRIRSATVAP